MFLESLDTNVNFEALSHSQWDKGVLMYFVHEGLHKKLYQGISPATQWGHAGNQNDWAKKDSDKHALFLFKEE